MHIDTNTTGSFEFIEHTADLAVRAKATTLPELFVQTARGMYALLGQLHPGEQSADSTIEAHAPDPESLLHDWLAELLWQVEHEKRLFEHFHFTRFDAQHLAAQCRGAILDPARSEWSAEVKAVTYHDLKIEKRGELYEVTVVFDI